MKGLQVFSGLTNADYEGEIKSMVSAPRAINTIILDIKIAQLIFAPTACHKQSTFHRVSGSGGGAGFWLLGQGILGTSHFSYKTWKNFTYTSEKIYSDFLDTGANISVISIVHWPKQWLYREALTQLQSICQTNSPLQCSQILKWQDNEGHSRLFQPYVLPGIPVNLWGRDILSALVYHQLRKIFRVRGSLFLL